MSRLSPYFGVVAAIAVVVVIINLRGTVTVVRPASTTPAPATTSSLASSTTPSYTLPPITLSTLLAEKATTTPPRSVAGTAKVFAPATKPKKVTTTPTSTPIVAATPVVVPPPPSPSINGGIDTSAASLRAALVNILCYVPVGGGLHSISGSGVFIDSKGIILTNAHIAQYFLLSDRGARCTIRTGSPAVDKYQASLIFISPAWLHANSTVLTQVLPTGTGEFDFALLAVSKSATATPLPSSFPTVPLALTPPFTGAPVVIATYGAQFLQSSQILSDLSPTVVFGSVKDVYTFDTNTIDVLALGGSAAAQEGSSGGGVSDSSGHLVGTITTSTVEGETSTRSLDAITASYIRADYASETGQPLDFLLSKPTAVSIEDFSSQISALESIITPQLQ